MGRHQISSNTAYVEKTPPAVVDQDLFNNPFTYRSFFHKPIGTGAIYGSSTHAMTTAWNNTSFANLNVNNGYGKNFFTNSVSDPVRTISGSGAGLPFSIKCPSNMRNPTGTGSLTQDSPSTLLDVVGGQWQSHEFYGLKQTGTGNYTALNRKSGFLTGTAVGGGTSASQINPFAMAWRGFEVNNNSFGPMRHSGNMVLHAYSAPPAQLANRWVWPSQGKDGGCNASSCTGPIPYGQLFAIPPSTAVPGSLDALGVRLFNQMRDYGCYVVDGTSSQIARGDQFVTVRTNFIAQMAVVKRLMRPVLNQPTSQAECDANWAIGGGNPLPGAFNTAYDSPHN